MESAAVPTRDPTAGGGARASEVVQAIERNSWVPADPGPLGLAGFAMSTFVLSMFNAHLVGSGGEPVVLGLALAYGGIAQLLAGMWEFRTGNTFGALAFSSFGAFWISFFVLVTFFAPNIPTADAGHAIGLYLWAWAIFTTYMFVASLRTTGAVALVFLLLSATFILLGAGNSGAHENVVKWGGYLGLATAAAAWYASFAAVTNDTFGRTMLPVMPLSRK
jgi:succinate-acetate transporter protein